MHRSDEKNNLNDVESFFTFGGCSERIKTIISASRSTRVMSIDLEHCFSVSGLIITPLQTRQSDEKFEIIIFMYENRDN